jgi:hypothetical protein
MSAVKVVLGRENSGASRGSFSHRNTRTTFFPFVLIFRRFSSSLFLPV